MHLVHLALLVLLVLMLGFTGFSFALAYRVVNTVAHEHDNVIAVCLQQRNASPN